MLRVIMLVYDDDDRTFEPRGSFVLGESGVVEIDRLAELPPEGVEWMREILLETHLAIKDGKVGRPVTAEGDPEGWMRGLPLQYDGMKMRALLEEE
jgi:hypothetical protein